MTLTQSLSFLVGQPQSRGRRVSQDGAGQGGGRGRAGASKQLPVGVVGVQRVDGMHWILLKASQVFVEAVAAFAVDAAAVVAVVEVRGGAALGDVHDVGAALPPQGRLAAGRGGRLAVRAAVAAGSGPLHRGDPDGRDGLRVRVEGRGKGDGGRELHARANAVGVEADMHVVEIGVVGVQIGVLEVVGVVGMQGV